MSIRFSIDASGLASAVRRQAEQRKTALHTAVHEAASETADAIVEAGHGDMQDAGNFGNWAAGYKATVADSTSAVTMTVTMGDPAPFYWTIHQEGRTIQGKPMLWIPLSFAGVQKGMWARDYPGGLFRVDRKTGGAPLLLSIADRQPKYSGHESVTIPKRLHLYEIAVEGAKGLKAALHDRLARISHG
jgi:hypothetical protein